MNPQLVRQSQTLDEAFRRVVERYGDCEALLFGAERVTYRQMGARVATLAAGFHRLGVMRGDNVALILSNCPEFLYTIFALAQIGAAAVPFSPQSGGRDVEHILGDARAVAVVTDVHAPGSDLLGLIAEVRPRLPALRHVIVRGADEQTGCISLASLLDDTRSIAPSPDLPTAEPPDPADVALILYTSGTTGLPKGAVHTHRTLLATLGMMVRMVSSLLKPSPSLARVAWPLLRRPRKLRWFAELGLAAVGVGQLRWLVMTPFYHVAGYFQLMLALLGGDKMALLERFQPDAALELIHRERVTILFAVPPMLVAMLSRPDCTPHTLVSLALVGTGAMPVPPQVVRELRERIGCLVVIGYGATEASVGTATMPVDPEDVQAETVGRPAPGVELKIVDDARRPVQGGAVGEIAVRGPGVMAGYYGNPESTSQVMDADGWYYTGDLGQMDERGYVRVVGRAKDMIIRAGANVYPAEVEHFLLTHPQIAQVAVIGLPSPTAGGEKIRAYVVPRAGAAPTVGDVVGYCWGKIAAYKVPDEVLFVDELPLTPALQKVQHFRLREQALGEQK
ncbi:MAG: AMP-binding protein [Chloroflexi bacterium]|nr:AMP-binding protein [Chloroflexota bacterium]